MGPILPPSAIENMQLGLGINVEDLVPATRADVKVQILESLASSQPSLSCHWMK